MDGHTHTRRQRTIAVPLFFLVVMCFLCALCHSSTPQAAPVPLPAVDCPEQAEESPRPAADAPARGGAHACEAAEGHGLPTAPPLFLVALGVVLAFASLSAPRPAPRRHRPRPVALHGSGLLTLLCVQRV